MIRTLTKPLLFVLICGLALISSMINAAQNLRVNQTKNQLTQLNHQINSLEHQIANASSKRGHVNHELESTEKLIGASIQQLHKIQGDMSQTQRKINAVQQHIDALNQQLQNQQRLLAEHVKQRYAMGEYQPMQWIINQKQPQQLSRLFTYYQYLVQKRQHIIDNIATTKKNIIISKETLHKELKQKEHLQIILSSHQKQLTANKQHQTQLMQSINTEIKSHQHTLGDYKRNRDNLSRLLKTLALQSLKQPARPFPQMKRKLPRPVKLARMRPNRQGVTFIAGEGQPVNAVYPGKVVFSDWLNGYGLLLIIDHGQGFMTLYAHNQSLFKHKGQRVLQGERIANVGHSGGEKESGLYFEVRYRGRAVPASGWLG